MVPVKCVQDNASDIQKMKLPKIRGKSGLVGQEDFQEMLPLNVLRKISVFQETEKRPFQTKGVVT